MKYYKANCDHSFYSQKGKLVFCLIKDELLTLKEIKRILCPHRFLIDKVIAKYFKEVSISSRKTYFFFGVRKEDKD
mgnify:CR=1 FL=1